MIDEAVRIGRQKSAQIWADEAAYKLAHGNVRPLISLEHSGMRLTAVGNEIHFSRIADKPYFTDFLRNYLQNKFTTDFFELERAKEAGKRHPVVQWYERMHAFQVEYATMHGMGKPIPATGAMNAWYRLAYDLFLIKHNAKLADFLLHRLRDQAKFQGARFELMCIAALICAGYKIEFEVEDDPDRKHVEFIAIAPSGLKIAVEAKSRHREGVLGYSRGARFAHLPMTSNVGADDLLLKALRKEPKIPYLVFIEINLPGVSIPTGDSAIMQEITASANNAVAAYRSGECPANGFVFCNDLSHHAPDEKANIGDTWFYLAPVAEPLIPLNSELMKAILIACKTRLNIPSYFPPENR